MGASAGIGSRTRRAHLPFGSTVLSVSTARRSTGAPLAKPLCMARSAHVTRSTSSGLRRVNTTSTSEVSPIRMISGVKIWTRGRCLRSAKTRRVVDPVRPGVVPAQSSGHDARKPRAPRVELDCPGETSEPFAVQQRHEALAVEPGLVKAIAHARLGDRLRARKLLREVEGREGGEIDALRLEVEKRLEEVDAA